MQFGREWTKFAVRFREVSGLESVRLERVDCIVFQFAWNWPLPKRVGTWVGIRNAKALGIVWRDSTSKNAAPLQLWLFVQPGTQQYCTATAFVLD